eukprot:TRINITY_DN135485_c1_g1_i1.p1 TRINITY_DN135485_c1_g1~~TRINITY_DN135485_c1_g1_i1.p1  ORF type:complete len:339 (+),score=-0.02 TRINITY_DN135485_c1_g1_i1:119-1018(+)
MNTNIVSIPESLIEPPYPTRHTKSKSHIPTSLQIHSIQHKRSMYYYNSKSILNSVSSTKPLPGMHKPSLSFIQRPTRTAQGFYTCNGTNVGLPSENIDEGDTEAKVPRIRSTSSYGLMHPRHKSVVKRARGVDLVPSGGAVQITTECSTPTPKSSISNIKLPQKLMLKSGVIKEGYLWKTAGKSLRQWNKKYCVLTKDSLFYYNARGDTRVKGCINFSLLCCKLLAPSAETPTYFKISVTDSEKTFAFKADTLEATKSWINFVLEASAQFRASALKVFPATYLPRRDPKFWKVLFGINT